MRQGLEPEPEPVIKNTLPYNPEPGQIPADPNPLKHKAESFSIYVVSASRWRCGDLHGACVAGKGSDVSPECKNNSSRPEDGANIQTAPVDGGKRIDALNTQASRQPQAQRSSPQHDERTADHGGKGGKNKKWGLEKDV